MDKRGICIIIMIFSVFISSVSQLMLKRAAMMKYTSWWREYINIRVILAYFFFFSATLITVLGLRYVPLSYAPVIESLGYIFISVLSYLFLKEKMSKKQICGMIIIVIGILIYSNDILI